MPASCFEFQIWYRNLSRVKISAEGALRFRQSPYVLCGRDVIGLFSNDMRVRDVQRYTICWPAGTNMPRLQVNAERSVEFRESKFCDRVPDDASEWPVAELPRGHPRVSRTVLLLLESPHVDEYGPDAQGRTEPSTMSPIAPAQGKTGDRIEENLADVLKSGDLSRELCDGARVLVANPVPYQASLESILNVSNVTAGRRGPVRRGVKDAVWEALWNIEAVRRDFEDRLRRYVPGVVINACTRILSKHVAVFVARHCPNSELYETTHPSRWFNQKNLWLKRVLF